MFLNEGVRFNQHWGYRTVNGKKEIQNEVLNYYNKPQITLKDFWKVNDKLSISNIIYSSIGRGGATRLWDPEKALKDSNQLINWDRIINTNQFSSLFGTPNIEGRLVMLDWMLEFEISFMIPSEWVTVSG